MKKILVALVFSCIFLLGAGMAWANEREPLTPELSMEQAVAMALRNSTKIISGQYSIDAAYEKRQMASRNLLGIEAYDALYGDNFALRYLAGLRQADIAWQATRKSLNLLQDSITYATHQAYNKLLQEQAKLRQCNIDKKEAELQRTMMQARYAVGVVAFLDLQRAETALVAAKGSVEDAQKALDTAYLNFNYLLGLWPQDRPVLTETPAYEKLAVVDLNNYIERSLTDNPSIWQKEKSVDLARAAVDGYDPWNPGDSYLVRELDLDQALLAATDAKDEARIALRTLYNSIRQIEEQYPTLEQSISLNTENLRVTQLKYEVGMATRAEVVSAETALLKAEKNLLDLVCTHDLQKLAFTKPWAIGMASR